jgi:hypothetical protein
LGLRLVLLAAGSTLFNPGGPSVKAPQIVQLGPAHCPASGDFQGINQRRVQGKYSLDTHPAAGDSPYGEVGGGAAAIHTSDYYTLEGLDAFPVSFADAEVDLYGVSWPKVRDLRVAFGFKYLGGFHLLWPFQRRVP